MRKLQQAQSNERRAAEASQQLQKELRELSVNCHKRMRGLQHHNEALHHRVSAMGRRLNTSVPAAAYNSLLDKCAPCWLPQLCDW